MSSYAVTLIASAIGFLAATLGAAATIVVTRTRSSGRIATSEAGSLWKAAEEIRKELYERVKEQNSELTRCHERIAAAESREEICQRRLEEITEMYARIRERLAVLEDHDR